MTTKLLILKFGFATLEATCRQKNWRIPTIAEARNFTDIAYDWIWVVDKYDRDGTKGVVYSKKLDKTKQVPKKNMQHCCVIKEEETA